MTTRAPDADAPDAFGAAPAARPTWLEYDVSVPPGHQPGKIEWPDGGSDPARNFTVRSRTALSRDAFAHKVAGMRAGLYIHGFNTRYPEALFRTAQLSADAHMEGKPVLFTWPSAGHAAAYLADRDASDFSRAALADLLEMLTRGRRLSDPVPVLAHSWARG
ncbi:alpha/beta hydrolase [Paracoccus sp. DMF-8]|uniref:alpha/beta hydrolase n=1 Tax=Paracoccus sp. DMF-8 TaxID=3019445 RepID=UPI003204ADF8